MPRTVSPVNSSSYIASVRTEKCDTYSNTIITLYYTRIPDGTRVDDLFRLFPTTPSRIDHRTRPPPGRIRILFIYFFFISPPPSSTTRRRGTAREVAVAKIPRDRAARVGPPQQYSLAAHVVSTRRRRRRRRGRCAVHGIVNDEDDGDTSVSRYLRYLPHSATAQNDFPVLARRRVRVLSLHSL